VSGAYYNEIDPFAAAWLRNLIAAGHIAPGEVDERSIVDVQPDDLKGYTQCHFFAGIGGWSLALRMAGWPDDLAVWSGSCPCQPLSSAGLRKGHADQRHLWPAFHDLIAQRRPSAVFGEQVASKDGLEWLAAVRADLEALGYACGAADLPAGGYGALHRRHRVWWVGSDSRGDGLQGRPQRTEYRATRFWAEEFARLVEDEIRVSIPTGKFGALANGLPGRVGRVRAYGNAIVPQIAAEFVAAFMECAP
jgi:DNA (cytosine-5)-methyltransferase 1